MHIIEAYLCGIACAEEKRLIIRPSDQFLIATAESELSYTLKDFATGF
jgi:hypothetical protein